MRDLAEWLEGGVFNPYPRDACTSRTGFQGKRGARSVHAPRDSAATPPRRSFL
jgi:hypothetical protein